VVCVRTLAAAAILLSLLSAGCTSSLGGKTSGSDPEHEDLGIPAAAPVLYLNLTVGNTTHRFASDGSASGAGAAGGSSASNGTATLGSGNSTEAPANATAGNATGNASAGLEGAAPLNISATLEAKGLPQATASGLSWALDFGASAPASSNATEPAANATGNATDANATADATAPASSVNGTSLPARADFTYTEAGTYEITASLLQGNKTLASLNLTLVVGGNGTAGVAAGTVLGTLLLDQEGTLTLGTYGPDLGCGSGVGGSASFEWEFPATDPVTGTTSLVSAVMITSTGSVAEMDADLYFYGPDGAEIASATTEFSDELIEAEGPFAPGLYTVTLNGCAAVMLDFTIHGEATLVAA
jgi:hypothetical protein